MLSPDLYIERIFDIDLDDLVARGIDTLLVDLDNTLVPRDSSVVPDESRAWVAEVKRRGMQVCLVSNNWHGRVSSVAGELDCHLVSKALKPLPFAFLRGLRYAGSARSRGAVIGDQMFTDILGGKLLGTYTVLVLPLSPSDLPHTLLLRRAERLLLGSRRPVTGRRSSGEG